MNSTENPTITFPNRICTDCGYDAGQGNGWFGTDSRCSDCRDHADRCENGWTPSNSVD